MGILIHRLTRTYPTTTVYSCVSSSSPIGKGLPSVSSTFLPSSAVYYYGRYPIRNYRILFFGTDNVSLPTLQYLHQVYLQTKIRSFDTPADTTFPSSSPLVPSVTLSTSLREYTFSITDIEVICPSDRPAGRGQMITTVPVKQYAQEHGLKIHEVPYGLRNLSHWKPTTNPSGDIGVVVSFGYFLPLHLLQLLPLGAINMHPSLLPKYRGAAPIPHAILNGDQVTGISIIEIHPSRFDAGSILLQEQHSIQSNDTAATLTATLAKRGAHLILHTLQNLELLRKKGIVQTNDGVTRAPKVQTSMGEITWDAENIWTVDKVWRSYRAFNDSIGIYTYIIVDMTKRTKPTNNGNDSPSSSSMNNTSMIKRINLVEIDLLPENKLPFPLEEEAHATVLPGSFLYHNSTKQLYLRMQDGWIIVRQIQPQFKRIMSGRDFANGQHMVPGKICVTIRAVNAAPNHTQPS